MIAPSDVLFRAGGRILARQGVPVRRLFLPARGGERMAELFARADAATCATLVDRAGTLRTAAAARLRNTWWDSAGTGVLDLPTLHLEQAATQLMPDPENFGNWTAITCNPAAGQADPFGGAGAYLLTPTGGATSCVLEVVAFTGNATKAVLCHLRAGTSTQTDVLVNDSTAVVERHRIRVTWNAGVPTITTLSGAGVNFLAQPRVGGWWEISMQATGVVAANVNQVKIFPDDTGANGTVFAFGVNAWNAVTPSSYQRGVTTRAVDNFTAPINFGPMALSVYVELVRTPVFDAAGAAAATVFNIADTGGAQGALGLIISANAQFQAGVQGIGTSVAIGLPAGRLVEIMGQLIYDPTTKLVRVALDVGGGLSAPSGLSIKQLLSWDSQIIRVGPGATFGTSGVAIADLIVARGLRTMQEFRLVP